MLAFGTVLAATDFSPCSRAALKSAPALLAPGGSLHVVHVVEPLPARYGFFMKGVDGEDLDRLRRKKAERHLARLVRRLEGPGRGVVRHVRVGRPWEELLSTIRETEAELLCLGNSGLSGFERLVLGSTAGNVLRRSTVPVLVTRRRPLSNVRRVLVPVDFEDGSEQALRFVADRVPTRSHVHALFVVPPPLSIDPHLLNYVADERAIERDLRKLLIGAGMRRARFEVRLFGEPAGEIVRAARRIAADLIVISTHGRAALAHALLGSVAERVAQRADRPVLVLPGPRKEEAARR
jgi:nucleotide-binding universal stress UspA family protein